jgi:ACT domain-containing protein
MNATDSEVRRAVVTVIGEDRVGIVAGVSTVLAEHGINIEDIRMATMGDLFTMIALVSLEKMHGEFATVKTALEATGISLGVQVIIQRREIFDAMHRV